MIEYRALTRSATVYRPSEGSGAAIHEKLLALGVFDP